MKKWKSWVPVIMAVSMFLTSTGSASAGIGNGEPTPPDWVDVSTRRKIAYGWWWRTSGSQYVQQENLWHWGVTYFKTYMDRDFYGRDYEYYVYWDMNYYGTNDHRVSIDITGYRPVLFRAETAVGATGPKGTQTVKSIELLWHSYSGVPPISTSLHSVSDPHTNQWGKALTIEWGATSYTWHIYIRLRIKTNGVARAWIMWKLDTVYYPQYQWYWIKTTTPRSYTEARNFYLNTIQPRAAYLWMH